MLIEKENAWLLPQNTARVIRVSVSNVLEIQVSSIGDILSVILTEFNFSSAGNIYNISVEAPKSVCPILKFIGMNIKQLEASKSGQLDIFFTDSSRIIVPFSSQFEAWEIYTSKGFRMISLPGGKLAVWR
jgi:hypothetical protein